MSSKRLPMSFAGAVALAGLLLGGSAAAEVHTLRAVLTGNQEVPPSGSSGGGSCTLTLDDVTGSVSVSGTYTGLGSSATAAHIHGPAPVGVNAGILVVLTQSGGTAGTLSGGGVLAPANIAAMLAGNTYVNVHTTGSPGGELRGQALLGVPSLSRAWMAVLVVLGLAGGAFLLTRRPTA